MLARQISAEGDIPRSAAVRSAFETGGTLLWFVANWPQLKRRR